MGPSSPDDSDVCLGLRTTDLGCPVSDSLSTVKRHPLKDTCEKRSASRILLIFTYFSLFIFSFNHLINAKHVLKHLENISLNKTKFLALAELTFQQSRFEKVAVFGEGSASQGCQSADQKHSVNPTSQLSGGGLGESPL